jgi:hypothetical protein
MVGLGLSLEGHRLGHPTDGVHCAPEDQPWTTENTQ